MATNPFTQGDTRITLTAEEFAIYRDNGSLILNSQRTRPFWFDGRFLAARDLAREQDYFLQRQADIAQAAGFEVIHGLQVTLPGPSDPQNDAETILLSAGQGITPSGELVLVPSDLTLKVSNIVEEQSLDVQFGLSRTAKPPTRTRTGLYVLALRPVEFTANPIASYPTTIQGSRTTHDGDIVEATAAVLLPYPDPVSNFDAANRQAALARQIFVSGSPQQIPSSILPLAMISLQRGAIEWVDMYLVRRDTGPGFSGLRFGLTNRATQEAFLLQYDSQLQRTLALRRNAGMSLGFTATTYFQTLPPAGRFPLASINVGASDFSQIFFPQQLDVRLSLIPVDELPALIEQGMSLPPIDLTLSPDAYTNLTVFALVPVPRAGFAKLKATLPTLPPRVTLPQVLSLRPPLDLLRLFRGGLQVAPPPPIANNAWASAIGNQTYGFYIRGRSAPQFVDFTSA
jgi:hypothetical protein